MGRDRWRLLVLACLLAAAGCGQLHGPRVSEGSPDQGPYPHAAPPAFGDQSSWENFPDHANR
jgi:hypothetical protein